LTVATNDQKLQEQKQQKDNIKLRSSLNNAYAILEGTKYTTTVSSFSFEEAVEQQIARILDAGTRIRPSELERVDKIEKELLEAVTQIKQIPPENFMERVSGRDVNTEEDSV